MPIHFRSIPIREPFTFDTVGNRWLQERVVRPKGYPLYHYLQTEKGRGRIEIQGKTYVLNEKEGVLIAPFISHSYVRETEKWFTLFATVTGTMESSIANMLGNRPVIFVGKEQGEKIEQEISAVVRKCEDQPLDAKSLSVDCYGLLMNFADGMYGQEMAKDPLYQKYVAPVIKEIETNYAGKLTAAELSSRVYVTPQHLSRLFGRFLGCSVYEYLTSYRITRAKELLALPGRMEVQNIANQVGFEDASHFTAMFRKTTGMTPMEFRALMVRRTTDV